MIGAKRHHCAYYAAAASLWETVIMLPDSNSDGEYVPALLVQVLSTHSLSSYLQSEGFSKCDVQELASESHCMPKYSLRPTSSVTV